MTCCTGRTDELQIACAVIGHALGHADSDIRTNRHAGASKRAKQGTLRYNPGSARLETLSGPFKDLDRPSLANEHIAGEHPCHGTPDDNCLFHRFLSGTFVSPTVTTRKISRALAMDVGLGPSLPLALDTIAGA
jgi:hypothetical protein